MPKRSWSVASASPGWRGRSSRPRRPRPAGAGGVPEGAGRADAPLRVAPLGTAVQPAPAYGPPGPGLRGLRPAPVPAMAVQRAATGAPAGRSRDQEETGSFRARAV
ncbi:hypothetical protein SUDANB6_04367 [Streptomyces sp. enrichment culture]